MTTYKQWAHRLGWAYRTKRRLRWLFSKWPIASAFSKAKRTCWADLVGWAQHQNELRDSLSGGPRCRKESADSDVRTCYCGKFADGGIRPKNWTPDGDAS